MADVVNGICGVGDKSNEITTSTSSIEETATEIVKASTLLSVIGVVELLLATQQVISRTYLSLELYFFAGLVFFLINFAIEKAGRFVERKVSLPN